MWQRRENREADTISSTLDLSSERQKSGFFTFFSVRGIARIVRGADLSWSAPSAFPTANANTSVRTRKFTELDRTPLLGVAVHTRGEPAPRHDHQTLQRIPERPVV